MTKSSSFFFNCDIYISSEYLLEQWNDSMGTSRPKGPSTIPVRLSSEARFVRDWCSRINNLQTGISLRGAKEEDMPQTINGTLLYAVHTDAALLSIQPTVIHHKVPTELFKPLGWQSLPDVPFVTVIEHKAKAPVTIQNPILQSYLDVCLKGCLDYGEDFALEFLETTIGWSKFWINDRSLPRRPWIHEKKYKILDELLAQYPMQGNLFHERKMDSEYSVHFVEEKLKKSEQTIATQKPKELRVTEFPSVPRFTQKLKEQAVHFVFGYGSLINHTSRRQTNPESKDAIPVRVSSEFGYIRTWNYHGSNSKLTALGVRKVEKKEEQHAINGIIYPVSGTDMALVDVREEGYIRVKVPWEFVECLSWAALPDPDQTQLWMYFPESSQLPNFEYPILQTYVDVCLNGCLEYGEEFALEFLETTFDWSQFWLNDRLLARRPWIHCSNYQIIDRLLVEYPRKENRVHHRKLSVEYALNFIKTDLSGK